MVVYVKATRSSSDHALVEMETAGNVIATHEHKGDFKEP
jgi:hypothetical protein